jgi:TadE-like protein
MFKRIISRINCRPRGQSFVELLLVTVILALLLAGVVEFGFLLNNYLHVLDAAREAARYSSTAIAYDLENGTNFPEFYYYTAVQAANTLQPIKLDPTQGDDIIISVLSVAGTSIVRHPAANGWSLCANYAAFVNYLWVRDPNHPIDPLQSVPTGLADSNWYSCPAHASHQSDDDIRTQLVADAPNAGALLVEILYNYPQMLKLPVFSNSEFLGAQFSLIPDPIPVYVYTIMPISSAEPPQ